MGFVTRALGRTAATATLAGLVTASSMVFGPLSQSAQGDRLTATTGVNLRSGPGLSYTIVGGLSTGQRITALGGSVDGWTPVDLNGRRVYVASRYVSGATDGATPVSTGATGTAVTTVNLNVRTGPSTSYSVVTTLGKGTTVTLTGTTSGGWTQISRSGHAYWVSSVYLGAGTSSGSTGGSSSGSTAAGAAYTTTALNVRTGPSTSYAVVTTLVRGTKVTTTGTEQNGWTQVLYNGATRWVSSAYLTSAGASASQPAPSVVTGSGTMYATTSVNVRTGPSTGYSVVTTLERGQQIATTGKTSNGWTEVVWQGAARWMSSQYLSTSNPGPSNAVQPVSDGSVIASALPGSVGLSGTIPGVKKVINLVETNWPVVGPYYGVRVEPGSDHNDGHAVDCMIPNWSGANKAVGDAIAAYLQAHARELNINYIIWRQHIWSVARSSEGWRPMADRGSTTANHYDHVHVSVY
ncbi:SH3 domain-containing protein [Raineyella sp. LH-20]|uniref:SH3 domain-containing protein n=1 Tax=Raineyella sp. LH-20 TaxID=3081204 RepID=UPI002955AEAE|nr:SH3 domain-containing protein [Raineyella sp. LH-20]WOP19060.1 SH3 domain-containing protein [Raineyella sp. LH-20]